MFRVEWGGFVNAELIQKVADAAGINAADVPQSVRDGIPRILASTGGLPFSSDEIAEDQLPAVGEGLLEQAFERALNEIRPFLRARGGYVLVDADEGKREIVRVDRLPLNSAAAEQLEALPGVGAVLAEKIVAERQTRGPFASIAQLEERVSGIGPESGEAIAAAAWLDTPADLLGSGAASDDNMVEKLAALVRLQRGESAVEKLIAAFDLVESQCLLKPHPANQHLLLARAFSQTELGFDDHAATVGVLKNSAYYFALPDLIWSSTTSVDVCMFHMVFPDSGHPTRTILDALVAAHAAGVRVRVLLDQDRPSDPYRSTIINTPAKQALDSAGIECRLDATDKLLHSKFLVIDSTTVVIGSHNWSAGSYFQFDDLSLVIESDPLAQEVASRFEGLWGAAAPGE